MKRVQMDVSVDATRLEACRRFVGASDDELIDRSLRALINEFEAFSEVPYEVEVPKEILALARRRKRR